MIVAEMFEMERDGMTPIIYDSRCAYGVNVIEKTEKIMQIFPKKGNYRIVERSSFRS